MCIDQVSSEMEGLYMVSEFWRFRYKGLFIKCQTKYKIILGRIKKNTTSKYESNKWLTVTHIKENSGICMIWLDFELTWTQQLKSYGDI